MAITMEMSFYHSSTHYINDTLCFATLNVRMTKKESLTVDEYKLLEDSFTL